MKRFTVLTNKWKWLCCCIITLTMSVSCNKQLKETPYSFLGEDNSYQSAADAVTAINGVYDRLRSIYGMPMLILADMNGEEMNIRPDGGANVVEIDKNTYTAANGNFDGFYTNSYLIIDRANRLLKNVPRITMNETQKAQILCEAKFLRALIYFDLVQAFGDVPLITAPTSDVVNVAIARTPASAVYAQIVRDLKEADAANLPVKYTASGEIGRATSGAVKSILAKVYLTQKDWTNAAAKAKEVIDGNAYSLFPDYKDIFPPANKNGREHIFSVQYSCVKTAYGSNMGLNFAIFFSWPIQQSGGSCQAEELFASSYFPDDYRKKVTIITSKVNPATGVKVDSRTGSHQDKYWDPAPCGLETARNNFMVIRYADVLLMYAEAVNEMSGPTIEAYNAINQVRTRARNGVATANPQNLVGLTQDQFRDAVLKERSWELCFEGHRRWDLLRTGKYLSTLQAAGIPAQQKNLLYPIPQNERDVNSALTQNLDY